MNTRHVIATVLAVVLVVGALSLATLQTNAQGEKGNVYVEFYGEKREDNSGGDRDRPTTPDTSTLRPTGSQEDVEVLGLTPRYLGATNLPATGSNRMFSTVLFVTGGILLATYFYVNSKDGAKKRT